MKANGGVVIYNWSAFTLDLEAEDQGLKIKGNTTANLLHNKNNFSSPIAFQWLVGQMRNWILGSQKSCRFKADHRAFKTMIWFSYKYLLFLWSFSVNITSPDNVDCDDQRTTMMTKNKLPSELLSLACSLPGIVSFWLKQQYQEAYRMHRHLPSSKDDLQYIQYFIVSSWFQ